MEKARVDRIDSGDIVSQSPVNSTTDAPRRGRPPKFGRPGHVVSVTLPDDTLHALNQVDPDTGWAIVKLLEGSPKSRTRDKAADGDVELARIGARRSLIVVNRSMFKSLPGVSLIPLNESFAFLALDPGRGMSDLELVVIDRLADSRLDAREREALERLRTQLASWRRDRGLRFHSRSIIVVEQVSGSAARNGQRGRRASSTDVA